MRKKITQQGAFVWQENGLTKAKVRHDVRLTVHGAWVFPCTVKKKSAPHCAEQTHQNKTKNQLFLNFEN
jgi:invasion protein IalB